MEKDKATLSPSLARLILERDEFTCTECGRQVPKVLLFIDKILSPESEEALGDVPEEDKYTCLCEECYKQAHGHLQIKAATRTSERRSQLEMLVEWRRKKRGLESDTTAYLIDYIDGKIEPFSLTKQGVHNLRKAIGKSNFTSAITSALLSAVFRVSTLSAISASILVSAALLMGSLKRTASICYHTNFQQFSRRRQNRSLHFYQSKNVTPQK